MIAFKEYTELKDEVITENTHAIKKHLSHLEDLAVEHGIEGYNQFNQQVDGILRRVEGLQTTQQVNLKIDGSMMILFGADPRPDYHGRFFIATKSGMSMKNPKINHSHAEINVNYPDEALSLKLRILFTELKGAFDHYSNIFQADVLFCTGTDKKFVTIEGDQYLIFTPNTITYAILADDASDLYRRITKAKVGIIIHEALKGTSINDGKAIHLSAISRDLKDTVQHCRKTNVFVEGSYCQTLKFNVSDPLLQKIRENLSRANEQISQVTTTFNQVYVGSPIIEFLKQYLNKQVEFDNGGIFGAAAKNQKFAFKKFMDGFAKFLKVKFGKDYDEKKTDRGRESVAGRKQQLLQWLNANQGAMEKLLSATYHMIQVKVLLLQLFTQVESKLGKTFIQDANGSFRKTGEEGFVFFIGSNHVKLVDRLEFSKLNRNNPKYK